MDLTRIARANAVFVAVASLLAYLTGWLEPGSILLGGSLMGANLWLMRVMTDAIRRSVNEPERSGSASLAVAALSLKFGLFLALIAALFWRLPIEGMSFAVGATLLLIASVLEATGVFCIFGKGAS